MIDTFKIATWNVNSLRIRLTHLTSWVAKHQPDIIALQEIKVEDKNFPISAIRDMGYHAIYAGFQILFYIQCSKTLLPPDFSGHVDFSNVSTREYVVEPAPK